MLAGSRKPGHRPGRIDNDRLPRIPAFTIGVPAPQLLVGTSTTPTLAGQQPHNAGDTDPARDPGDHPHRARPAPPAAGLGDQRDEEGHIPGQTHLSPVPDAYAGSSRGHGRARRCQD